MNSREKCSVIGKEDRASVYAAVKQVGLKTNNAEIEAAVNGLLSSEEGLTSDVLFDQQMYRVIGAIRRVQIDSQAKAQRNKPIGNVRIKLSNDKTYNDKVKIASDSETLYVFEDSAQAREALTGEKTGIEGVEAIADDTVRSNMLNVATDSSVARTDINGNPMPNALGIITSKNKISNIKRQKPEGITEQDESKVLETIKGDLEHIREVLNSGKYKSVVMPSIIKGNMSGELAEKVAALITEILGIRIVDVRPSYSGSSQYHIVLSNTQGEKSSSKKNNKTNKDVEEGAESLLAERPTSLSVESGEGFRSPLQETYPDLTVRKSRVDYFSRLFSMMLSDAIESTIERLEALSPEELEFYVFDDGTMTNAEMLAGLKKGDEKAIRLFALGNLTVDSKDLVSTIFNMMFQDIKRIAEADIDDIADMLLDGENVFSVNFLDEAAHKGWGELSEDGKPSNQLLRSARIRARTLKSEFGKMANEEIFSALAMESRYDLEINEGIVMTGDVQFSNEEAALSPDGMVLETQQEIDNEELDEESLNTGKMDFLLKYKLVNPKDTLSARMRSLIGSLHKITKDKYGNEMVMYDDLGMPVRLNPSVVYYILLDSMSNIVTIEDMDNALKKAHEKYPWLGGIINKLMPVKGAEDEFDWDLRREFFRAMNKPYIQYGFISNSGKLVKCNSTNASEVMVEVVTKNYEGGNVLGTTSIYDSFGTINQGNVEAIKKLLTNSIPAGVRGKVSKEYLAGILKKECPLHWAKITLQSSTKGKTAKEAIADIRDAILILRGEYQGPLADDAKMSLEELLKNIGIDTFNMNLDEMLPVLLIDEYEYVMEPTTGDILLVSEEGNTPILTKEVMTRLRNILDVAANIMMYAKPGMPLVHTCKEQYRALGSALSMVSDAYTQPSFRFGDKTRYSYSVPSFIDRLAKSISQETDEEALAFIEREYGDVDFYQNPVTGEYFNGWLQMLSDISTPARAALSRKLRRNFEVINMLAFWGSNDDCTIQKVRGLDLVYGAINAFFNANSAEGVNYAYYRNPLFSDTDAMVFFKFRRFTSQNEYDDNGVLQKNFDYKKKIVSELVKVLKQELTRIRDLRSKPNGENIEFFNTGRKNGHKLNFFPSLNPRLEEILSNLEREYDESASEYAASVDEYLTGIIQEHIDKGLQEFLKKTDTSKKYALVKRLASTNAQEATAEEALDKESKINPEDVVVETFRGFWTREVVENTPDKTFLFGDNLEDAESGYVPSSTQAVIRGLDNAIGIPTKKNRGTSEDSYFTDEDFDEFKELVDAAIEEAILRGNPIVLPDASIGTGAAQLAERAPKLFNYLQQQLSKLSKTSSEKDKAALEAKANELLTEFYYNDYYAQSQILQLIGGDLAYYKDFTDFIKRNKQAYAAGERLYYKDEDGNELVDCGIYLEDMIRASNTHGDLNELLESTSLSELEKASLRGAFSAINTTDGQTLRTMPSFKKLLVAMGGKWTDNVERAYKTIESGEVTPESFQVLWQAIKPFLYSSERRVTNGRIEKIVTQHKNSEYLLTAMYTLLNTALNTQSPLLKGLNRFMVDHNIDSAHFHSVVKEGYNNGIDLNYDPKAFERLVENGHIKVGNVNIKASSYEEFLDNLTKALNKGEVSSDEYNSIIEALEFKDEQAVYDRLVELTRMTEEARINRGPEDYSPHENINPKMVHTFPLSDYMVMQPSDDHLTDTIAKFGSQLRNIVPADLPQSFTMTIQVGSKTKTLNREEAVKYYNRLFVEKLVRAFSKVSKEFSSPKAIEALLQAKMKSQPSKYTLEIRNALTLDETGTRFKLPLNSPNLKNKIEELLISEFKNSLQKQTIKGGNAVLVSNFGLHKDLKIQWKINEKGEKVVDYIPVYLTHTMSSQLKDFLKPGKDGVELLDFELMEEKLGKEAADELLTAVGYRIPTEDKYSMFPIKIVGFMPAIAGCTIMMPSDVVEMSGTDFDIDKLFLMLKSIRRETHSGELVGAYYDWLHRNGYLGSDKTVDAMVAAVISNLPEGALRDELSDKDSVDSKFLKRLSRFKKSGFTEQQIASFLKDDLFYTFMEEEGYEYEYETPKYNVLNPTDSSSSGDINLEEVIKQSDNATIDNMIIDFVYKTLTSHEGTTLMMRQGTFRGPKHASRMQRILDDTDALRAFVAKHPECKIHGVYHTMKKLSTKELENFYETYARPKDPMDIMDWTSSHKNLMDGNDLIGMLAVNSSAHYKLQFYDVRIRPKHAVRINGNVLTQIDRVVSPVDGKTRIGEICAQFQAASPDNGKDPCLGDLNLSPDTISVAGFLMRLGLDIDDMGIILNATSVRFFEDFPKDVQIETVKPSEFNMDIARLVEVKTAIALGRPIDYSFIKSYKTWYSNIEKIANDLNCVSPIVRTDSPNGALNSNYTLAIQQILKLDEVRKNVENSEFTITGLEELFDTVSMSDDYTEEDMDNFRKGVMESNVPRLSAIYQMTYVEAPRIIKRQLPDFSDASLERLRVLADFGVPLTWKKNVPVIKKFLTEFNTFNLSKSSVFGETEDSTLMDKRNYYIHDYPIKFKAIVEAKMKKGGYINPNIRNLPSISRLSNRASAGITLTNVGKISPDVRKWYTEAFDQLLNMPESVSEREREVAKELAVDLLLYAYYSNGLTFRHNSYGNFFSTSFISSIPGVLDTYRESENLTRIQNIPRDREFVLQFLMNNPEQVPTLGKGTSFKTFGSILKIYPNKDTGEYPSGINTVSGREFLPLVRIGSQLYRFAGEENGALIYKKVDSNKTGAPYYDCTKAASDIKFGNLQERGDSRVSIDKVLNKAGKVNTKLAEESEEKGPKGGVIFTDNYSSTDDFLLDTSADETDVLDVADGITFNDSEDIPPSAGWFSTDSSVSDLLPAPEEEINLERLGSYLIYDTYAEPDGSAGIEESEPEGFGDLDEADNGLCRK